MNLSTIRVPRGAFAGMVAWFGMFVCWDGKALGESDYVSPWTQNRQGFGPWGSNIPNDVNAGRPWMVRPAPTPIMPSYPQTPQPSLVVSNPTVPRELSPSSALVDDPDGLPEATPIANGKPAEAAKASGGKGWYWWALAGVLGAGGLSALFGRRRWGLILAVGGTLVLGVVWLVQPNARNIASDGSPESVSLTDGKKSFHPVPDFETFKEKIVSPNPYYRAQAIRYGHLFGEKAYPFLEVEAMAGSIDAKQALYRVDPVRRILSLMKLALQYGKDGNDERMKKLSGEAIFDLQSAMVYPGPYPPFPSNTYLFAASQEAAPTEILLEIVSTKGAIFRHDWRADNYEYSRARSILLQRLAGVSATQKSNEDIENDLFQGKIGKEQFLRAIANRHVEWLIQNAEISPNDYRPLKIEMLPDVCKVAPSALAKLQRAYASFLSSKNYGDLAHAVRAIAASGDEGEEFLARDLLIIRGEPGKIRPIQLGRLQVKLLDSPSPKLRDAAQVAVREWLAEIRENKPIQQNQFEDADRVELQGFLLLTLAAAGDQYAYAEMRTKRLSLLESYSAYSLNYGTWGPWHKSDAAKRELGERVQEVKTVIESGKPIPEELRWLLFKYPKEFGNAHDFYLHHVYREPQTDDDAYRTLSEMLALGIDCSKVLAMLLKRERATTLDLEGLYLRLSANDFRKLLPSLIKYMEENASSGSIAGLCLACYILHQNGADAKEAGPVLVRLARQGNKSLRMNALMALENVKSYSEESFAEIVRGVKSRDREIRKNAMRALLRFEDRAAIVFDDVAPLLKSDDSEERNAAASLLSSMGPPVAARAIEALQPFPEFGRQVEWLRSVN